jgi:hypothetical protein
LADTSIAPNFHRGLDVQLTLRKWEFECAEVKST